PLAADGVLQAAARAPAPDLAPALDGPRLARGDRELGLRARRRAATELARQLSGRLRPLRDARECVPVPDREPVPRLRRQPRQLPDRRRAACRRPAEPVAEPLP